MSIIGIWISKNFVGEYEIAQHVCPVWMGYLLASPLRKLLQNPKKILNPYIREGMKALDLGCDMGFFSLPLAEGIGPTGKIVCLDIQEKIDFGLVFAVVHEVPNTPFFFSELYEAMELGEKVLLAEPKGHVSSEDFEEYVFIAEKK